MDAPHPSSAYSADDLASRPLSGSGYCGTLPVDGPDDTIERLHKVIEEITRKPVAQPEPRRIGFL